MDYFRFDMIKRIARTLCALDNIDLRAANDPLRLSLSNETGLPFAPEHYKIWRNYKRVFGCCFLAAEIDGKMICTELCQQIAENGTVEFGPEDYFAQFIRKFYYPSPIFEGYQTAGRQIFPICAIIKLLLARQMNGQNPSVGIGEISQYLLGNNCTGEEPVDFYQDLKPKQYQHVADEVRQIRELVRFASQISILKWRQPELYLDINDNDELALQYAKELSQPAKQKREKDPAREIMQLGRTGNISISPPILSPTPEVDVLFSEGRAKRVLHLRYERSPKLREFFFAGMRPPYLCDMCSLDGMRRYNWVSNILEIHHLLPLASPLRVDNLGTSLSQLVGVCPSCHKATHLYYSQWLDENSQEDFESYDQARSVYEFAKKIVVLDKTK